MAATEVEDARHLLDGLAWVGSTLLAIDDAAQLLQESGRSKFELRYPM